MTVPVPATIDALQELCGQLRIPSIRVWCHPNRELPPRRGDAYYKVFDSFAEATVYCKTHPKADDHPLIAFRGYELDLFQVEAFKEQK